MENHVSKLHSYFHPWTGHIRSARHGEKLFQGTDGSTSSPQDPHNMHSGPMARNSMSIQRWSSTRDATADTHDKSKSNPLDDPCTLSSRKSLNTTNRTMIYRRYEFRQVRIRQDPRRLMKMKAQLSPSTECEGRHHHPLKKREKSSRSRRSPSHCVPCNLWKSALQHHGARAQIWEIPVKPFGENARPHGMHR